MPIADEYSLRMSSDTNHHVDLSSRGRAVCHDSAKDPQRVVIGLPAQQSVFVPSVAGFMLRLGRDDVNGR